MVQVWAGAHRGRGVGRTAVGVVGRNVGVGSRITAWSRVEAAAVVVGAPGV